MFLWKKKLKEKENNISLVKDEIAQLGSELVSMQNNFENTKNQQNEIIESLTKKSEEDSFRITEMRKIIDQLQLNKSTKVMQIDGISKSMINNNGDSMESQLELQLNVDLPQTIKKKLINQGEVNSVCFSTKNNLFATGGNEKVVKIWDTVTAQARGNFVGSEKSIMSLCFSNDDEFILAACNDNAARIWSVSGGRIKHSLIGHLAKVYCARFSSDSQLVVTGSYDRTLKAWDIQKGYCIRSYFATSSCNDLGISNDTIISGHIDFRLRFWDTKSKDLIHELSNIHSGQITSVSTSIDTNYILTNSRDNTIKVIDVRTYEVIQTYRHDNYKNNLNSSRSCFSPDSKYIVAGSANGEIFIWNTNNGTLQTTLTGGNDDIVSCCSWSSNGAFLATSDRNGNVVFWGS